MDIRSISGGFGSVGTKTTNQAENTKSTTEKSEVVARRNDEKVTLTDASSRLRQAQTAASLKPEVNSDRVEQLRRALAEGTYKVNPERLAGRLMAFESALRGR